MIDITTIFYRFSLSQLSFSQFYFRLLNDCISDGAAFEGISIAASCQAFIYLFLFVIA